MDATDAYTPIVVALASARIAVLIAHDVILDKPREWWFRRFPPFDNLVLGYDYQSRDRDGKPLPASLKREGYMVSELLTCTRCLTVWVTLVLWFTLEFTAAPFSGVEVIAAMAIASWGAKKL